MSRTRKDKPYRVTGAWTHRYYCSPAGHSKFTRSCRRAIRARQKADLNRYGEIMPDYPRAHEYFD